MKNENYYWNSFGKKKKKPLSLSSGFPVRTIATENGAELSEPERAAISRDRKIAKIGKYKASRMTNPLSKTSIYLCNPLSFLLFRYMDIVTFVKKMCGATFYIKGATFEI